MAGFKTKKCKCDDGSSVTLTAANDVTTQGTGKPHSPVDLGKLRRPYSLLIFTEAATEYADLIRESRPEQAKQLDKLIGTCVTTLVKSTEALLK